jgi:hypothetical protein
MSDGQGFREGRSEVFEEAARAIDRALGRPGWPTVATFAAALVVDPTTGEPAISAATTVVEGLSGQERQAAAELNTLLQRWLEAQENG